MCRENGKEPCDVDVCYSWYKDNMHDRGFVILSFIFYEKNLWNLFYEKNWQKDKKITIANTPCVIILKVVTQNRRERQKETDNSTKFSFQWIKRNC